MNNNTGIKDLAFGNEGMQQLQAGVNKLADAVKVTLGPSGCLVAIEQSWGRPPKATKDGVSVAREILLEHPVENAGAQMVKEVAERTVDGAGDGTTTATVLAQAIINLGVQQVAAGNKGVDIKRGIDKAVEDALAELEKYVTIVGEDPKKVEQIATVSVNGDSEMGKLIAEAVLAVTKDGDVTVEESKTGETFITVEQGLKIDSGYMSPVFVNNREKLVAEYDNPLIFLSDMKYSSLKQYVKILEYAAKSGRPLIMFAETFEGEALSSLAANYLQGKLQVVAVRAPMFGLQQREMLKDMAAVTGATLVSDETGFTIDQYTPEHFGSADKVIVGKTKTTIVGGIGDKDAVNSRMDVIRAEAESSDNEISVSVLKQRLARLTGGVAVLHVGANSELELSEKKDRIEDALFATKAAMEEGVVPGGGTALMRCYSALRGNKTENPREQVGYDLLMKALTAPLYTIADNCGASPEMVVAEVTKLKGNKGFDAANEDYTDLVKVGIIDPKKVTRLALSNAASVAGLILTTKSILTYKRED